MDLTKYLLFTFLTLCTYLIFSTCGACRELKEEDSIPTPLLIPLETQKLSVSNLRRLGLSKQKLHRLITDCNSNSIVRAIRRPNIVSEDSVKLRLCLSLLDVLHNAKMTENLRANEQAEQEK